MSACNAGDLGSIPGSRRSPWRRKWQPTPVFMPEESHGQRSLIGYSPWGHKESDMTERLHFHLTPLQVGATHLPKVAGQTALENQGLIGQRASQECLFCHRRPAQQITLWGITYSTHHHTHTLTGTHTYGAARVHVPASPTDPCSRRTSVHVGRAPMSPAKPATFRF